MIENIKLYKETSLDIVDAINKDKIEDLEVLFTKRQSILDEVVNLEQFKKILIDGGILEIDKNIQMLLLENIDKVKREIKEYRLSRSVNTSYINFTKENLNIFNKKV